jgi:hypothetical protein
MGGTIAIVPNATAVSTGWVIGGGAASVHAALSDNTDTTYVTDTTPGSADTSIRVNLSNPTLPSGAGVRWVVPIVRASQASGTKALKARVIKYDPVTLAALYASPWHAITPTGAIQNFNINAAGELPADLEHAVIPPGVATTQEILNGLYFEVKLLGDGKATEDHRVYELDATVYYVDSPVASGLALDPTDANTKDSRPAITWISSNDDGISQYEYRVAVWSLTDINTFPGGRTAFEADAYNVFDRTDTIAGTPGTNFIGSSGMKTPLWGSQRNAAKTIVFTASSDTRAIPTVDLPSSGTFVYYVQVSGLWAGSRITHTGSMAKLDVVMAITPPTAPTSVTPTWQGTPNFRTSVAVVIPAQTLGTYTTKRVFVERRIVGTGVDDWELLPTGYQAATSSGATLTFYDTLAAVGRTLEYRARIELSDGTYFISSIWTGPVSSVVATFTSFVLRNPASSNSTVLLRPLGDLRRSKAEVQGQFRPLGSRYPIIVSDSVIGRTWAVEARVKDQATAEALDALREAKTPLVLQTDMTDEWYWVRVGENVSDTLIRQPGRFVEATREQNWQFDLIEVNAAPNQPQFYG